jgi:hypothetical protein
MPNEGDQEQKKEIIESDHQIEESIKARERKGDAFGKILKIRI